MSSIQNTLNFKSGSKTTAKEVIADLDLSSKSVIITGANSGIGYFTALELARAGASVIVACRSAAKGQAAVANIKSQIPAANVVCEALDLASLASVRDFAARMKEHHTQLDILINNAGLMALPKRETTADGFEMQIGVNFLGHFVLTALLLPLLIKAPAPRTVQLASIAARNGRIDLADFQNERRYKPMAVYNQTKLATLMFGLELQRRSQAGGWGITSLIAHPGIARTELVANGPKGVLKYVMKLSGPLFEHSGAAGSLPILLAATSPNVEPGGFYGPTGFQEFRGPPGVAKIPPRALDEAMSMALWAAAEGLTGTRLSV